MTVSWLSPVSCILNSQSEELRELALSVGADPKYFYVNQDLSKCDLRGQDLRGMDLTGTNINRKNIDESTLIDPEFDPAFQPRGRYVKLSVSLELLALLCAYEDDLSYRYRTWSVRSLYSRAFFSRNEDGDIYWNFIRRNPDYFKILEALPDRSRIIHIKISDFDKKAAMEIASDRGFLGHEPILRSLILEGILAFAHRDVIDPPLKHFFDGPDSLLDGSNEFLELLETGEL